MEEIANYLQGVYYLATAEADQPHVRPFDGACVYNEMLCIGTISTKKVAQQMIANPKVEIFAMGDGFQIRFTAEARLVESDTAEIYAAMGKDASKDNIAVFSLSNIRGTLIDSMGAQKPLEF